MLLPLIVVIGLLSSCQSLLAWIAFSACSAWDRDVPRPTKCTSLSPAGVCAAQSTTNGAGITAWAWVAWEETAERLPAFCALCTYGAAWAYAARRGPGRPRHEELSAVEPAVRCVAAVLPAGSPLRAGSGMEARANPQTKPAFPCVPQTRLSVISVTSSLPTGSHLRSS